MEDAKRVTYRLDPSTGLIETRCAGPVSLDDVMQHFVQLQADPRLPERLDVLLDLTEVTSVPEAGQLRRVADAVARISSVELRAFAIVATRDVLFGMSRVFEVFIAERFERTRVFRRAEEARHWLANPEAEILSPLAP